jgi:hypothetical protein
LSAANSTDHAAVPPDRASGRYWLVLASSAAADTSPAAGDVSTATAAVDPVRRTTCELDALLRTSASMCGFAYPPLPLPAGGVPAVRTG